MPAAPLRPASKRACRRGAVKEQQQKAFRVKDGKKKRQNGPKGLAPPLCFLAQPFVSCIGKLFVAVFLLQAKRKEKRSACIPPRSAALFLPAGTPVQRTHAATQPSGRFIFLSHRLFIRPLRLLPSQARAVRLPPWLRRFQFPYRQARRLLRRKHCCLPHG